MITDRCAQWRTNYNAALNAVSALESQLSAATSAKLSYQVDARNAEIDAGRAGLIYYTPEAVSARVVYWMTQSRPDILRLYQDWQTQYSLIFTVGNQLESARANAAGLLAQGIDAGCIPNSGV